MPWPNLGVSERGSQGPESPSEGPYRRVPPLRPAVHFGIINITDVVVDVIVRQETGGSGENGLDFCHRCMRRAALSKEGAQIPAGPFYRRITVYRGVSGRLRFGIPGPLGAQPARLGRRHRAVRTGSPRAYRPPRGSRAQDDSVAGVLVPQPAYVLLPGDAGRADLAKPTPPFLSTPESRCCDSARAVRGPATAAAVWAASLCRAGVSCNPWGPWAWRGLEPARR